MLLELAKEDPFIARLLGDRGHSVLYAKVEKGVAPQGEVDVSEVNPPALSKALREIGISKLYKYQYETYLNVTSGRDVIVTSGTGTGKTEAFIIPLMARALAGRIEVVVYPTKALARDQEYRFLRIAEPVGLRVAVYDADAPVEARRLIYSGGVNIILTNPDMLNTALIHVPAFRRIISRADYVFIDEVHVYNGVLGSHMHYLARRIMALNPDVRFGAASATVSNPAEFFGKIIGRDVVHVNGYSGPRGELIHVMVKPLSRGRIQEVVELVKACIELNKKCIVFADSHYMVEAAKRLADSMGIGRLVAIHRAGLRPEERRLVEDSFRSGEVKVVLATPTLELGIDIGDADVVVLATNPPSYIKYLQRVGRVGRRGQRAYAIQVLGDDPMSTYYSMHPDEFYNRTPEPLYLEVMNDEVAKRHLLAMVREHPVRLSRLGDYLRRIAQALANDGYLTFRGDRVFLSEKGLKLLESFNVIRGVGDVVLIRRRGGGTVGFRELPIAIGELHPGAIYMHGGRTYRSIKLDLDSRVAIVEPFNAGDLATRPLFNINPTLVEVLDERRFRGIRIRYAVFDIEEEVYGYVVRSISSGETLSENRLEEPIRYSYRTRGILVNMPPVSFSSVEFRDLLERGKAYHAVEHVLISAGETVVNAAPTDMGGISYPTGHIVIYDTYPGGSGVTRVLMDRFDKVVEVAYSIVTSCTCRDGCPRCVYSPYCGNNNRMLSRLNSIKVFESLLRGDEGVGGELPFEGSIP